MILSILIFLPLLLGLVLLFIKNPNLCHKVAAVFSSLYFLFSLYLFFIFDPNTPKVQLAEQFSWFPKLGISYFVGIDGLSFWFIILTAFLLPVCVFASWKLIQKQVSFFYFCLFMMNTSVMGTFLSLDAAFFYIFFESSLIPLYFIIGIWGGKERIYACFKFFIYTALGSLFLLAAIVALMILNKEATGVMSASLLDFYKLNLNFIPGDLFSTQNLLFLCCFLAFAVKLPLAPFHTWLPLAHVEAPAPGSAVLAAVILKMGAYGFLRFLLPIFPDSFGYFAPIISFLAGLGLVYGALMALAQTNIKKLVAYSSVSHMAYVLIGFFSFNFYGLQGGYYQLLTHAVSSAGLFLLVGMIYERTHNLNINDYGGLALKMPRLTILFIIVSLSAIALPSTGGFISEFLVLMAAFFSGNKVVFAFALTGLVLGAAYVLYLIHRVFFGELSAVSNKTSEISFREIGILTPFIILVFLMGIFPNLFFKYSEVSLKHLQKQNYELDVQASADTSKLNKKELLSE